MSKGWDNATLKKLKALTGKGLSTSEIGKRLGLSKNAVVGKLNRLGWNLKAAGGTPAKAEATQKTSPAPKKANPMVASPKKATTVAKSAAAKKITPAAPKKMATKTPVTPKAAVKTVAPQKASASVTAPKSSKSSTKNLAMHQRIIQHSLEMANLKPNQCRWPIGDPDSENFHFCGETVFVGKPYCYEHCKQAYQFTQKK